MNQFRTATIGWVFCVLVGLLPAAPGEDLSGGPIRLLGADPESPRFHFLVESARVGQYRWQERLPGEAAKSLVVARKQLGVPAVEIAAAPAVPLAELLQRKAADLGMPRNPLRIVVARVSNPQNQNEAKYLNDFQNGDFGQQLRAWSQNGAQVEYTDLAIGSEQSFESALRGYLTELRRAEELGGEVRALPVLVVLWAENRLKLGSSNPTRGVAPVHSQVIIVNVANAMLPPLAQRGDMRKLAASQGWFYDEIQTESDPQRGVVRRWDLLSGRTVATVRAHLDSYRVVSLTSAYTTSETERRFAAVSGADQAVFPVRLSPKGQAVLQEQGRAGLRELLRGDGLSAYAAAQPWLAAFDTPNRAKAVADLARFLTDGAAVRVFESGRENEATDLLRRARQDLAGPDMTKAAASIEKAFDAVREKQFAAALKQEDFTRAETRLGSVTAPTVRTRLQLDLLFTRGLARVRGDQLSEGTADLAAWYEGAGASRNASRATEAAESIVAAAIARGSPSGELLEQWFGRLRAVKKELTPSALKAAGDWLAAADNVSGLLERAVRLGDLAQARAALRGVSGASEKAAWLEFTLGEPSGWREWAAADAAASPAQYRLQAALSGVEAAQPVAETFAALYALAPTVAMEALTKARSVQNQMAWLERNPQAALVSDSDLPFRADLVALARRTPGVEALLARREKTGTGARVWFEYYRLLPEGRCLRLELIGGPTRAVEAAAEPLRRAAPAERARLLGLQRFEAMRDGVMMAAGLYARGYYLSPAVRDVRRFAGSGGPLFSGVPAAWRAYAVFNQPPAASVAAKETPPPPVTTAFFGGEARLGDRQDLAQADFVLPIAAADRDGTQRAHLGVALWEPPGKDIKPYHGTLRLGLKFTR